MVAGAEETRTRRTKLQWQSQSRRTPPRRIAPRARQVSPVAALDCLDSAAAVRRRNAPRERHEPHARKPKPEWARPDLDWRPSGYQPDAPTGLSYGPANLRKRMSSLKRCLRCPEALLESVVRFVCFALKHIGHGALSSSQ